MDKELQGRQYIAYPSVIETNSEKSEDVSIPAVTDSESDEEKPKESMTRERITGTHERETDAESASLLNASEEETRSDPMTLDFILQEQDEEDENFETTFTSKEQEYLHWHTKLGHLGKSRMQQLAKRGVLPKHLAKIDPPICSACIYGKATKTPWRTKTATRKTPRQVTKPGECVAVDQLESSTPGFIGQLKGAILTKQRYKYATVFVDMFSDYTYLYFHTAITSEETLKAKQAFEAHASTYGVKVENYHADNGRFQDIKYKQDCHEKGQTISYCGVNAHFQNGRAEKKIRDLQDTSRTSLLHAVKKWPNVININLWPYAMRYANDVSNLIPRKDEELSPIEKFSGIKNKIPLRQFHHFGCPTYVLSPELQANKKAGTKWKERSRLGVNLGFHLNTLNPFT